MVIAFMGVLLMPRTDLLQRLFDRGMYRHGCARRGVARHQQHDRLLGLWPMAELVEELHRIGGMLSVASPASCSAAISNPVAMPTLSVM